MDAELINFASEVKKMRSLQRKYWRLVIDPYYWNPHAIAQDHTILNAMRAQEKRVEQLIRTIEKKVKG